MSQTFSKIKSQHVAGKTSAVQNKIRNQIDPTAQPKGLYTKLQLDSLRSKSTQHKAGIARYGIHLAIISSIAAFIMVGKYSPSLVSQNGGGGSAIAEAATTDQTSVLAAGSMVATSTHSVIASDVKEMANTASSQVYLATAGDGFLAKKQPIQTAGSQTRDITTYAIKNGDTLWSISAAFNVTTDTIKWANDLSDDSILKPGAELTILPVNGILYTAHGGEDVGGLATKYQANASLIDSYNDLQGVVPADGQKLIIPDGVMPQAAPVGAPAAAPKPTITSIAAASPIYRGSGNGYWPGQCTWYVASRRAIPSNWGNAYSWYYNAQASGYAVGSAPRAGAIGWERGINHVVYVESVNANGSVNISEMNFNYQAGILHFRTMPASAFLYIY